MSDDIEKACREWVMNDMLDGMSMEIALKNVHSGKFAGLTEDLIAAELEAVRDEALEEAADEGADTVGQSEGDFDSIGLAREVRKSIRALKVKP